jgi:hypothetical protein
VSPQEEDFEEQCVICGEMVTMLDINNGNGAEMYDERIELPNQEMYGIVHTNCGLAKGWVVA